MRGLKSHETSKLLPLVDGGNTIVSLLKDLLDISDEKNKQVRDYVFRGPSLRHMLIVLLRQNIYRIY